MAAIPPKNPWGPKPQTRTKTNKKQRTSFALIVSPVTSPLACGSFLPFGQAPRTQLYIQCADFGARGARLRAGAKDKILITLAAKPCDNRATARLAQPVERKALNLVVVGSSPTVGVYAPCPKDQIAPRHARCTRSPKRVDPSTPNPKRGEPWAFLGRARPTTRPRPRARAGAKLSQDQRAA